MWYHLLKVVICFLAPLDCMMWSFCSPHSAHILSKGRFFPVLDPCTIGSLSVPIFISASFCACMFSLFNSSSKNLKGISQSSRQTKASWNKDMLDGFLKQRKNHNVFRKCSESKSSKTFLWVNDSKNLCQWITRQHIIILSGFPPPSTKLLKIKHQSEIWSVKRGVEEREGISEKVWVVGSLWQRLL